MTVMLAGVEHEIGDVITTTFYPQGEDGPMYQAEVRITGWDEAAKTMSFESLDGSFPFSITGLGE